MKKIFSILSLLLVIGLSSCSSDDNGSTSSSYLLKQASAEGMNMQYTYSGNKIATWQILGHLQTFEYTGNVIVKTSRYMSGNSSDLEFEVFFEYDQNQRLISEKTFFYHEMTATRKELTYNSNNTVSYQYYSGDFSSQTNAGRNGVMFINEAGDVYRVEEFSSSGNPILTADYTFDDKNTVFKDVLGFDKIHGYETGRVHNVLEVRKYNGSGELTYEFSNSFTYNSDGYPTIVTTSVNSGSGITTSYTYW